MGSSEITTNLPLLDEHQLLVAAPSAAVWDSLNEWIARTHLGISERFAYLLGAEPRTTTGTLPGEGSTFPGFAVAESVPGHRMMLAGRHRFAQYAFLFTLTSHEDGTMLSARSYALFPGPVGFTYRQLVIGSSAHRILVRRMLQNVGQRAERQSRG